MNIKFQEKIFTTKKVIQLWNFGNFGIPEIIPKSPVTLRFSKVSLCWPKGRCKCFQMRYWPNFYVDPTYSNSYFFKVGKRPVFMQATVPATWVRQGMRFFHPLMEILGINLNPTFHKTRFSVPTRFLLRITRVISVPNKWLKVPFITLRYVAEDSNFHWNIRNLIRPVLWVPRNPSVFEDVYIIAG